MAVERFLDTNILLYAYDVDAGLKRSVAQLIIEDALARPASVAVSVQVLQEFHVNFIRLGHSLSDSAVLLSDFSSWKVVDNTMELLGRGLAVQECWQLSFWDSMIVAAAQSAGAKELVSEDLSHGQEYGTVRVVNPFLG